MLVLVTTKLCIETRYFTSLNMIAIFPATYILYLVALWYANWATMTTYRFAVLELH